VSAAKICLFYGFACFQALLKTQFFENFLSVLVLEDFSVPHSIQVDKSDRLTNDVVLLDLLPILTLAKVELFEKGNRCYKKRLAEINCQILKVRVFIG